MNVSTAASTSRDSDNAQWQARFQNIISLQADRLLVLVNEKKRTPDALQKHFDSIMALFHQSASHPAPATRLSLIKLVRSLHPLPVWWGKWSEWIHALDHASHIAQEIATPSEVIWLQLRQAEMYLVIGNTEKALTLAQKAHHLATLNTDIEMIFRAELIIFEAKKTIEELGDLSDAICLLEKSLAEKKILIPPQKAQELEIEFILQKIEVVRRQKEIQEAIQLAAQAQKIAENIFEENDLFMAKIFAVHSSTYWANQEHEQAIASCKKTIELFGYWGNHSAQIETSGRLGLYYWSAEQHHEAEKMLQSSISMAENVKSLAAQAIHTGNLGLVHFSCGRLEKALALTQQHYALSKLINNIAEIKRATGNMGAIQTHLGDFENALKNLRLDHNHAKKIQLRQPTVRLYAKIAWALDGLGLYDEAMEHAEQSLFLAQKMDESLVKLMALRSLSEVARDPDDKIRYAEAARQLAVKHSRRLNEAATLLTLAGCRQDESLRAEGIRILQEIGAENWLNAPPAFKTIRIALLL